MELRVIFQPTDGQVAIEQPDGSTVTYLEQLNASEHMAIQLRTLFEAVIAEARKALPYEGEIEVRVSGSLDRKAIGGGNYLFFNVGAEASRTTSMEVVLKTKINPED
ncbi:hypothetical protein HC928_01765 [bacterium]|nr:hypothetical protein [bacterium]